MKPEQPTTMRKIFSGDDYRASLQNRELSVYLLGEQVEDPFNHPIIKPSVNAVAETYDLGVREPELAMVTSPFTGEPVSRFLHVCTDSKHLVHHGRDKLFSHTLPRREQEFVKEYFINSNKLFK